MEIEDLFGEENPFYMRASAFPSIEPVGDSDIKKNHGKHFESERFSEKEQRYNRGNQDYKKKFVKKPNRQFEKVTEENFEIENYNNDIEFLDNLVDINTNPDISTNLESYSREATRNKLSELTAKLEEFDEQQLVVRKKLHTVGVYSEQYQYFKCIKLANLFHLTKEAKTLFEPNFVSESISFLCHVNSPCYIEYFLDYTIPKYIGYNIRGFVLPQEKYNNRLYELRKRKLVEKHVENILDFAIEQENVANVVQRVKDSTENEGLNFLLGIKSERKGNDIYQQEKDNFKNLLLYLTLAANLILDEKATMIIKFYNTFLPKTVEYIFLFYCLFTNISSVKPLTSSVISNQRFMLLRNVNKRVGNIIGPQLLKHFDLLKTSPTLSLVPEDVIRDDTNFTFNLRENLNFTMISNFLYYLEILMYKFGIECPKIYFLNGFNIFQRDTRELKIAETQKIQIIENLEAWKLTADLDEETSKKYQAYKEKLERKSNVPHSGGNVASHAHEQKRRNESIQANKELINPDVDFKAAITESSKQLEANLAVLQFKSNGNNNTKNNGKTVNQLKNPTAQSSTQASGLLALLTNKPAKPDPAQQAKKPNQPSGIPEKKNVAPPSQNEKPKQSFLDFIEEKTGSKKAKGKK